jgi:hypothetical protein
MCNALKGRGYANPIKGKCTSQLQHKPPADPCEAPQHETPLKHRQSTCQSWLFLTKFTCQCLTDTYSKNTGTYTHTQAHTKREGQAHTYTHTHTHTHTYTHTHTHTHTHRERERERDREGVGGGQILHWSKPPMADGMECHQRGVP